MIRGQIELSDELFRALTKLPDEMIEWLRQEQNQLRTLPEFIHYEDLESSVFPSADTGTLLYVGFDIFIKDTDWYSLRGGRSYAVGSPIPSGFTAIDYTAQPVGTVRTLVNVSGATVNNGATLNATQVRGARIQAGGMTPDAVPTVPAGSVWYSFVKLSNNEAGDFVRVS